MRNEEEKMKLVGAKVRETFCERPGTSSRRSYVPARACCLRWPAQQSPAAPGGNSSKGPCLENAERYFHRPLNRIIH